MFVPDDIWVWANFKETQLDHMRPGQKVTLEIDAYPERTIRGHVASVQPGSGTAFSLLPAENATGNYVKIVQRVPVKIVMDDPPADVALGPGMSVGPDGAGRSDALALWSGWRRGYERRRDPDGRSRSRQAARGANPWLIAVLVALATFMEVLDTTIANVALPYIAGGLGVSEDEASWVVTTYLVANAIILTASAFLAKTLGRKRFFLICLALFTRELGAVRHCLESADAAAVPHHAGLGRRRHGAGRRSRSWRIRSRRRSAARPSRCSGSRSWWRRWSGRHWAAGWPTMCPGTGAFLINGPVGVMAIALIALVLREPRGGGRGARKWRQQRGGFDVVGFVLVATFLGALGDHARPRARGRLVRLVFHHRGCDRLRARVRADDPVGR